jgi:uncharacterized protein (DUF849 family)
MRGRYDPIVLTAAVSGGDTLSSQSPHIPFGVERIVAEAVAAARAGAACVHLHGRRAVTGEPTGDPAMMAEIAAGIRAQCDVVISFTTGGSVSMGEEERFAALARGHPDIATFNLGTMNYEGFPTPGRWPKVEHEWEKAVLEGSGDSYIVNSLRMLRRLAALCREHQITPELEAYDLGHLSMARFLLDEGTLVPPVRVQFVLGVLGGAANGLDELFLMKQAAERILGRDVASMSVAATGYPMEFRHCAVALGWGIDCRVGLEDSLRVRRDRQATSNAELVEVVVRLADLLGRPLATPAELRAELGPWAPGWAERAAGRDAGR